MTKHATYRWPEIKEMLEDIQPENKCYSRVQALIQCGNEILVDHARLSDIIYRWHEKHTTMSYALKQHIKTFPDEMVLLEHGDILTWLENLKKIVVCDKQ